MDGERAPAWWPTRILLAVGIGLILVSAVLVPFTPQAFSSDDPVVLGPLLVPTWLVIQLAALLVAVVGLVWMFWIARGPREKPPRWRYRDR